MIPPEDVAVEQSSFRAILDFRLALESGDVDADEYTDHAGVREAFDLPDSIADETADDVLDEAVTAVVADEIDRATERLSGTFGTVCERAAPDLLATDTGTVAACHRHDEHEPSLERSRRESGS